MAPGSLVHVVSGYRCAVRVVLCTPFSLSLSMSFESTLNFDALLCLIFILVHCDVLSYFESIRFGQEEPDIRKNSFDGGKPHRRQISYRVYNIGIPNAQHFCQTHISDWNRLDSFIHRIENEWAVAAEAEFDGGVAIMRPTE